MTFTKAKADVTLETFLQFVIYVKHPVSFRSFLNAAAVAVYTGAIARLLFNAGHFFKGEQSFLIPFFILLLFIISATTTGFLVLGQPIQLCLAGDKRAGIEMLAATLLWLVLFALLVLAAFALF